MFLAVIANLFCLSATALGAVGSQFYGYGSGITGLPFFYADGVAYVGNLPPPNATVATNITLTQNADDGSFTATPVNSTLQTGNWTSPELFINNNAGAFDSAGFTSNSSTTITTTGFDLFGTLLVWISDSGDITTKWYADPVSDGLWVVKWNVDNVSSDTAKPLVLKTLAPPNKIR